MVVCKYFLQGTCKFGTYCHYEHQAPSNYTNFNENSRQSTSILRQANFNSAQVQNTKSSGLSTAVDVNTLIKAVANDMTGAEKGGQWFLSCYAPFKEKPAFPGFEDQSPEEIRLGFYEAQKNGTVDQYKAQLQAVYQMVMLKIKALQNPPQDVVAILQNIYATPPSSYSGTYGQNVITNTSSLVQQNIFSSQNKAPFGQNQDNIFNTNNLSNNANIFGGVGTQNNLNWQPNQGQANVFGNVPTSPTQNLFGGNNYGKTQNTVFGSQPATNIFASSSQTPSSNIFSNQAQAPPVSLQSSVFSGTPQTSNIFGSPATNNQNTNIFASQNATQQQQPIFGQPASQQPQQNIFAMQQPQNVSTQHIFSSQNLQQNLFNVNQNASLQHNAQATGVQSTPQNYSASIFGNTANSNPSVGFNSAVQQPINESLYSKLEELTEEERKWFESDTLDIMNIPDNPPTYNMCFKG